MPPGILRAFGPFVVQARDCVRVQIGKLFSSDSGTRLVKNLIVVVPDPMLEIVNRGFGVGTVTADEAVKGAIGHPGFRLPRMSRVGRLTHRRLGGGPEGINCRRRGNRAYDQIVPCGSSL